MKKDDLAQWRLAKGSCGYSIGDQPVYAAYVNGVALFAFQSGKKPPFYLCVVPGLMSCGGHTLEEAQAKGVKEAQDYRNWNEYDRRMTREQFLECIENPERLPAHSIVEE